MFDIDSTPEFEEHFKRRANGKIKKLFAERVRLFAKNPYHPSLRNHILDYNYKGLRSWSLTDDTTKDDFRVIYKVSRKKKRYIFTDFGTHDQLYRDWKTKQKNTSSYCRQNSQRYSPLMKKPWSKKAKLPKYAHIENGIVYVPTPSLLAAIKEFEKLEKSGKLNTLKSYATAEEFMKDL